MSKDIILVYTVGKVASTSISTAILNEGLACYDIHNLMEPAILRALDASAKAGELPPAHIGSSVAIYHEVRNTANRVKIITSFRDSLNRNISAAFQNLPRNLENMGLEEVRRRIEVTNPDKTGAWMRKEFTPATGIDLISAGFDPIKKYGLYSEGRFDVLMLRTDLDDDIKQTLISDFIGAPIKLKRENDGGEKWYSELYEDFKLHGKITSAWIDECLNSPFMKTFYTEEEQLNFKNQADIWRV